MASRSATTPSAADQVAAAFARIEDELISSMVRNMDRHRAEELEEGFDWAQWQALQLQAVDGYARRNAARYGREFDRINERIDQAVRKAHETGASEAEARILEAVRSGWDPPAGASGDSPGDPFGGSFFRVPQQRLDALAGALHGDMMRAEHALLRRSEDVYRQAVFAAQIYAESGAGTYAKAVDMATHDLLAKGIDCVQYANGSRHGAEEYARMAVRTAAKRAQVAGDAAMRDRWGVHTVVVAPNPQGCPECQEWSGQVLVDDVYGSGSAREARDGGYALLSEAMAAGLFHPNCRDSISTWFEGVSERPKAPSKASLAAAERREELEAAQNAAERTAGRYGRLSRLSLDEGNRERYAAKADEWEGRAESLKSQIKQERKAAAEKRIQEDAARQLEEASLKSAEAQAVLICEELAASIDSNTLYKLASHVDEAMASGDVARVNAAKLLADDAASGRLRISSTTAEKSRYLSGSREIELTPDGAKSPRTLAHEAAHLRDHQSIVTYAVEKEGKNGKVLHEFTVTDANYTTLSYGKEAGGKTLANRLGRASKGGKGDTAAWRDCKKRLGVKTDKEAYDAILARAKELGLVGEDGSFDNIRSLSDFIHAASNGHVVFEHGHWKEIKVVKNGREKIVSAPDWSETSRVLEPWADYDATLIVNPVEADLIRELFPVETVIMDEMREVMAR